MTITPEEAARFADGYVRSHETAVESGEVALEVVEGALPASMRGVLYRNGPGRFERGGHRYGHIFDGDGLMLRFGFEGDRVTYRSRFVRTREYVEEERAGRVLFRGFGTNIPGGFWKNAFNLRFKNAANTSVVWHGGRLLALWEGGLPYELDPTTLETRGPWDAGGRLLGAKGVAKLLTGAALPFSAHPRRDLDTGALLNFGSLVAPGGGRLAMYDVDASGRMKEPAYLPLDEMVFLHDFVLTPRYRVFLLCKTVLDLPGTLLGLRTPESGLQFTERPTTVLLAPRDGRSPIKIEMPACYIFHFTNAFDDGKYVVVDGFRYDEYPRLPGPFEKVHSRAWRGGPYFTRFLVDSERGEVKQEVIGEHLGDLPSSNPGLQGRPYRYAWAPSRPSGDDRTFFTGVARFDAEAKSSSYRELDALVGEALFVPRPNGEGEDDGWVTTLAYVPEHHRSDLFILDAGTLATVCRLRLPQHVPPGFHGTWVAAKGASPAN